MEISNPVFKSLIQSYNVQKDGTKQPNLQSDLKSFANILKLEVTNLNNTNTLANRLFSNDQVSSPGNLFNSYQSMNNINQMLLYTLLKSKLFDGNYNNQAQIYSQNKAAYSYDAAGNYNKLFKGDVFLGDSITKGLSTYKLLDDSNVYAKVGAGTIKVEEMVDSASKQNPKRVFIMSGINDIGSYDKVQFAQHYRDLINTVKAKCPNAKIYVQSILPVSDQANQTNPILNNERVRQFNSVILQISQQENVSFVDTSALVSQQKHLYANDGVHYKPTFYPIWLNFLQTHAK